MSTEKTAEKYFNAIGDISKSCICVANVGGSTIGRITGNHIEILYLIATVLLDMQKGSKKTLEEIGSDLNQVTAELLKVREAENNEI